MQATSLNSLTNLETMQAACFLVVAGTSLHAPQQGITMQAAVRKLPNAFNLVFHMKLLQKMGHNPEQEALSMCSLSQGKWL